MKGEQSKFDKVKNTALPFIGSILLLPVVIYFMSNNGKFTFIDYVNLLIHEGGHGIFHFFGRFIYVLGGTFMQLLIPGLFVFYYMYKRKTFPSQLAVVWFGENLLNVAVYAADARAHKLPLLGGNKVYHDWTYLLNTTNLILYDYTVGQVFRWLGITVLVFSLFLPFFMRETKNSTLELNL